MRHKNQWEQCSFCHQIKLIIGSNHKCPDAAKIKREVEIEMVMEQELTMFEIEQDEFWKDPRTKFLEHLASEGKI